MGKAGQEAETLRRGWVSCPWPVLREGVVSRVRLEGPEDSQTAWQGGKVVQVLPHRDTPYSGTQDLLNFMTLSNAVFLQNLPFILQIRERDP